MLINIENPKTLKTTNNGHIQIHPDSFLGTLSDEMLDALRKTPIQNTTKLNELIETLVESGLNVPENTKISAYNWNERQITAALCCIMKGIDDKTALDALAAGNDDGPIKNTTLTVLYKFMNQFMRRPYAQPSKSNNTKESTNTDPKKPNSKNRLEPEQGSFLDKIKSSPDQETHNNLRELYIHNEADLDKLTKGLKALGLPQNRKLNFKETTAALALYVQGNTFQEISDEISDLFEKTLSAADITTAIKSLKTAKNTAPKKGQTRASFAKSLEPKTDLRMPPLKCAETGPETTTPNQESFKTAGKPKARESKRNAWTEALRRRNTPSNEANGTDKHTLDLEA